MRLIGCGVILAGRPFINVSAGENATESQTSQLGLLAETVEVLARDSQPSRVGDGGGGTLGHPVIWLTAFNPAIWRRACDIAPIVRVGLPVDGVCDDLISAVLCCPLPR